MEPKKEYYNTGELKSEQWLVDGVLHRVDGPAIIIYYQGNGGKRYECWRRNNKNHRVGGPAFTWYYGDEKPEQEQWYVNGIHHRIDGPANVYYYFDGKINHKLWYINGNPVVDIDSWLMENNISAPYSESDEMAIALRWS